MLFAMAPKDQAAKRQRATKAETALAKAAAKAKALAAKTAKEEERKAAKALAAKKAEEEASVQRKAMAKFLVPSSASAVSASSAASQLHVPPTALTGNAVETVGFVPQQQISDTSTAVVEAKAVARDSMAELPVVLTHSAGMDWEPNGLAPEQPGETVASLVCEASGLHEEVASMDWEANGFAPKQPGETVASLVCEASGLHEEVASMDRKASGLVPEQPGEEGSQPALEAIAEPKHTSPQLRQLQRQASAATEASSYLEALSDAESSESSTLQMHPREGAQGVGTDKPEADLQGELSQAEMPTASCSTASCSAC